MTSRNDIASGCGIKSTKVTIANSSIQVHEKNKKQKTDLYIDLALAAIHLISGSIILSETGKYSRKIFVSIYANTTHSSVVVGSFDIMLSIGLYFLTTSLFHFLYAFDLEKVLGLSKWIEYSITAGLMIDILGVITGTVFFTNLVMLWGLIATTMLFGHFYEKEASKKYIVFGVFPFLFAWTTLFIQFGFTLSFIDLPDYAVVMLPMQFVLFSCFALIPIFITNDHCYDLSFKLLSLTSKLVQGWVLFAGVKGNFDKLN